MSFLLRNRFDHFSHTIPSKSFVALAWHADLLSACLYEVLTTKSRSILFVGPLCS